MAVQPPIFVIADEPLLIFESLDRARQYVEWQDVEDGIYQGYDSDGRRVGFGVETVERKFLRFATYRQTRVVIDVDEQPRDIDTLRDALRDALVSVRVLEPTSGDLGLDELKGLALDHFGLT